MKFSIILFNISKSGNFGNIIRTANAFGAEEICMVGRRRFSTYGNQKTVKHTKFNHFFKIHEAIEHYKSLSYDIVGIEITDTARSINDIEFKKDTVFIMGNEGSGIREDILPMCDYCTYIPQFGSGASLNVNVSVGIVLNSFMKSNTQCNSIDGYKFVQKN